MDNWIDFFIAGFWVNLVAFWAVVSIVFSMGGWLATFIENVDQFNIPVKIIKNSIFDFLGAVLRLITGILFFTAVPIIIAYFFNFFINFYSTDIEVLDFIIYVVWLIIALGFSLLFMIISYLLLFHVNVLRPAKKHIGKLSLTIVALLILFALSEFFPDQRVEVAILWLSFSPLILFIIYGLSIDKILNREKKLISVKIDRENYFYVFSTHEGQWILMRYHNQESLKDKKYRGKKTITFEPGQFVVKLPNEIKGEINVIRALALKKSVYENQLKLEQENNFKESKIRQIWKKVKFSKNRTKPFRNYQPRVFRKKQCSCRRKKKMYFRR